MASNLKTRRVPLLLTAAETFVSLSLSIFVSLRKAIWLLIALISKTIFQIRVGSVRAIWVHPHEMRLKSIWVCFLLVPASFWVRLGLRYD